MNILGIARSPWKLASALAVAAVACATSPTGRKQLMLVEDEAMTQLGEQSFAEIGKQMPESQDPAAQAYVQCVANNIVRELGQEYQLPEGQQWDVKVFQNEAANAFALPGGNIGVFTGLLDVAENQHQLAAVMAHEVGHVIAEHGGERMSQALLAQGGLAAAGALLEDSQTRPLVLGALGLGTQVGVLMPYGRKQESEADIIGLRLMAKAGFDPRESVELWRNMSRHSPGGPPEFLSTHPSPENRIENLQSKMEEAMALRQQSVASGGRPRCPTVASSGQAGTIR